MLLSEPFVQDEFNKILSQRSTNVRFFFYHTTEPSELSKIELTKINKVPNILISPCRSAMFWNFCVGIHRYSVLTYDVIKSYITRV